MDSRRVPNKCQRDQWNMLNTLSKMRFDQTSTILQQPLLLR
jgi:hypothetical protein